MAEKKYEFRYFKSLESFKRNLQWLIDNHFLDKSTNMLHERFIYSGRVSRDVAVNYYIRLKKSYERYRNSTNPNKGIKLPVYMDFQHILSLMDVLKKDELTLDDVTNVLKNAEQYYDKFFNEEKLKNKDSGRV